MTPSLPEMIRQVCEDTHVPMAGDVFGKPGVDAMFILIHTARELYRHVELERISGRVVIYQTVAGGNALPPPSAVADFTALANCVPTDLVLEIGSDGVAYHVTLTRTPEDLAMSAVVYQYREGREEFLAGSQRKAVLRLDPSSRSQFSVPTLSTLREALRRFATENIRECTCFLFEAVWNDPQRLFLKVKPETQMRRSLTAFLRNRLGGDHEVWPEQNVDESHPVDIQVKPRFSNNRVMLIEIKWLGASVAADGHVTTSYGNPRAQSGADQLANYLDQKRRFSPGDVVHGYLVVIDARRRNLSEGDTAISKEDGFFYETQDLVFDPAHHLIRSDFDPPYRMFARPKCTA